MNWDRDVPYDITIGNLNILNLCRILSIPKMKSHQFTPLKFTFPFATYPSAHPHVSTLTSWISMLLIGFADDSRITCPESGFSMSHTARSSLPLNRNCGTLRVWEIFSRDSGVIRKGISGSSGALGTLPAVWERGG